MTSPYAPLRALAARLPGCAWARDALTFHPPEVADYELVFAQAGVALPDPLRAALAEGAFELAPAGNGDEEAGLPLVGKGQRLLSPRQLIETHLDDRRFGHEDAGWFWVFVAPPALDGIVRYAFDLRHGTTIVPIDTRNFVGVLHHPGGTFPDAQPDFDRWLLAFVEQIVATVEPWGQRLEAKPSSGEVVDVAGTIARLGRSGWKARGHRTWRPVLRAGDPATALAILDDVADPLTRPHWSAETPHPIDLLYRLPTRGPFSRRRAFFEVIAEIRPEHGALAAAYDWLHEHVEDDAPAPRELFRDPQEIGWAHRRTTRDRDMRWARGLLWAMGHPWPEPLYEAIELAHGTHHGSRDLFDLAWRRIGTLAVEAGVL